MPSTNNQGRFNWENLLLCTLTTILPLFCFQWYKFRKRKDYCRCRLQTIKDVSIEKTLFFFFLPLLYELADFDHYSYYIFYDTNSVKGKTIVDAVYKQSRTFQLRRLILLFFRFSKPLYFSTWYVLIVFVFCCSFSGACGFDGKGCRNRRSWEG
jgi:hypothetical protein